MYLIRKSKSFKKSFEKIKKSGIKDSVFIDLKFAINTIAKGDKLPESFQDHILSGEYLGYHDCHIRGDLILIYNIKKDNLVLVLIDLGSHSDLF